MRPFYFLACILIHCSEISPWVKDVTNWWTLLASASKWGPFRGAQSMNLCTKLSWPFDMGLGFSLTKYNNRTPLTVNIVDILFSNPVIHLFHFRLSFNLLGDASLLTEISSLTSCLRMMDLRADTPKVALENASSRSWILVVSILSQILATNGSLTWDTWYFANQIIVCYPRQCTFSMSTQDPIYFSRWVLTYHQTAQCWIELITY